MALRETIGAKALDLLKAVFGELRIVTPPDHVSNQLLLKISNRPDITKRRHRTAQSICFFRGKSGGFNGDAHRLLLEQGHAERLVQDLVKLVRRAMLW